MPVHSKLHHFHCEHARCFNRAYLNFGASVPAGSNTLEHAGNGTLVSYCSFECACSEASSALAANPGEYSEASIALNASLQLLLKLRPIRVSQSFDMLAALFVSPKHRLTVLASLTACRRVCDRLGGHFRRSMSNHVQTSSDFSIGQNQSTS